MTENNDFEKADTLYDQGDFASAFKLFFRAAESGDSSAMSRLACLYFDGEGVDCDICESISWDQRAINAGSVSSMLNLAITYRTQGNIVAAKEWYEKAIDAGDSEAALQLAKLYMVTDKERDNIVSLLSQSIELGNLCEESMDEVKALQKSI